MSIQTVIFDIGNVLVEWNPERHYDAVIGEERRLALFDAVDLTGMNEGIDRGDDFRTAVHDLADAHPDWRDEILRWHAEWLHLIGPAIDRSVRLLRALRAGGTPVFALSNFGIQTFEIAETTFPFLAEFDRRFISGHMGVIKPDSGIYARVEAETGLDPKTFLFTDDRPENIEAARRRGWQVHHFDGPDSFARRLVAEGLLTEEQAA